MNFKFRRILKIVFLIFCYSCEPNFKNDNWPDNSLKTRVIKGTFKNERTSIALHYKEGTKDTSNFYLKEVFLENGQILERALYKNGQLNGKYEAWYSTGQKSVETYFENNEKNGLYVSWYPNGDLLEKMEYDNGKIRRNLPENP